VQEEQAHYLTVAEVAARLKVSRVALWQWRRRGLFPKAVRIGTHAIRFRVADIEEWERQRPAA
jgi:excisionase family DNA binding protein